MTPAATPAIVHAEAAVAEHFRRIAAGGAPIVIRGALEADCPAHDRCRYARVVLVDYTEGDGGGEAFVAVDRSGTHAVVLTAGGGAMDAADLVAAGATPDQAREIMRHRQ